MRKTAGNLIALAATLSALLAPTARAQTPHFVEVTKVHRANPQQTTEDFGRVVSIDGDTMIVARQSGLSNGGAAYIYVRNNGAWGLQQALTNNMPNSYYGGCVDISGDTAIVAAPQEHKVYVYLRTNSVWALQDTLVPDLAGSYVFGYQCAISGNTVLAGEAANGGSVYVYVRNGTTWAKQTKLTEILPKVGAGYGFGTAVAIDGDTAAVGVGGGPDYQGAIDVFVRTGTTWAEQQKVQPNDVYVNDQFGASVALHGSTLIAGAHTQHGSGLRTGVAYVFTRSANIWTQQQKLLTSDGRTDANFGSTVTVENDVAIIGSHTDNSKHGNGSGSAYVFSRSGATWTEIEKIYPADNRTGSHFGYSVDISNSRVAIGAVEDSVANLGAIGSAYVFASAPAGCTYSVNPSSSTLISSGGGSDTFAVITQSGCPWQATIDDGVSWVTSTSASTGSGSVSFNVTSNSGQPRLARIRINGQPVYWVKQRSGNAEDQGDLDTEFGAIGLATTSFRTEDHAYGVAVQADGKIVAVGQTYGSPNPLNGMIARYNTDGTLDTSFDGDGILTSTAFSRMNDIVLQTDGKIVVTGWGASDGVYEANFVVARYTASGALDTTFDTDGIIITDLGGSELASSIGLASDGKLVVAGLKDSSAWAIARYTTTGALDTTFDFDGIVTTSSINAFQPPSVAVYPDGRLVVVGSPDVIRYQSNGAIDLTFGGGDGRVPLFGRAVAIAPGGEILVGGGNNDPGGRFDYAVTRLQIDGSLDPAFGTGGTVQTNFGYATPASPIDESYTTDTLRDIVLQPNGKIVAVGTVASNQYSWSAPTHTAVARYTTNGVLDTTFNGSGMVRTTFPFNDVLDLAEAVALQSDGNIIVAGAYSDAYQSEDFMILRILGEGANCSFSLSRLRASYGSAAGTGSVDVNTTIDCAWTAFAPGGSFATITAGASGTGSGTVSYSVSQNTTGTARTTALSIAGVSFEITQNAAGLTTFAVTATASSSSLVTASWPAVAGASSYELHRSGSGGGFSMVASGASTSADDGTVVANSGYLYRVHAKNSGGSIIAYSNVDLAVAITYTDATIVPNTTSMKAAHLTQLRTAANAARSALGWAATTFTGTISTGAAVQRVHLTELRTEVDAVRAALGMAPLTYTDPAITAGSTPVKAAHIMELRAGLQ